MFKNVFNIFDKFRLFRGPGTSANHFPRSKYHPHKVSASLKNVHLFDVFYIFFWFFDTYFDIFDIKIKDSELGTYLLSCASKFRFGWSNFQPLAP